MAASKSIASDDFGIEDITSALTRTVLADHTVLTSLTVATSTKPDEMDEIANCLGQTILGGDNTDQRLAALPAEAEKAVEEVDSEEELDAAHAAKKLEKGKGKQTNEEEETIEDLGVVCSNWSLHDEEEEEEEAKAQRVAKQAQEQIKNEREDQIRASKIAEENKESDEYDALERLFQEHGAKAHEIVRKERKTEAERQLRLAAEAEAITLAERRAQEERQMEEEALAAQARRDADDRARLQLLQVYERNIVESTTNAIAQANVQEVNWQQQCREGERIAQYHEAVTKQAQAAKLERWEQEEAFLQQRLAEQHQPYPPGEQVAESIEEMDTGTEGDDFERTEMDTALEMEASGEAEMEWEQVEDKTPLLAQPPFPSSQSLQLLIPLAEEPSVPIQEIPFPGRSVLGGGPASQVLQPEASSSRIAKETWVEADATPTPTTPEVTAATAESAAPARVMQLPPRAATPPSLPAPAPAPAPSSPETIKIVFKRTVPNPTLAAFRPTISVWSPLSRLLSQQKSIPQVVLPQVLGKRAREDWEDDGRDKKKAKLEGELRLEVRGKRKREAEEFPGNKRVMLSRILGRALAVPGSRFAASLSITSPPTFAPTLIPPNAPPAPPPPAPSPLPPPPPSPTLLPVYQPRPVNPHHGLTEAINLYNDLPTLRVEIEWMRAQRRLNTSREETRGKKAPIDKAIKRTVTSASYWSRYRENLLR